MSSLKSEVMQSLAPKIDTLRAKYLLSADEIWQPSDYLPSPGSSDFSHEISDIQEQAREFGRDFWVVLVGDTITEEALPSYESWLMDVQGVDQHESNGWARWVRQWTAEENRHGDLLNKYLYLCGRVDVREVEITTQLLIQDGIDIGTSTDPYKNFVYTAFQELATHCSHLGVGKIAEEHGGTFLRNICSAIATDEMKHYCAYRDFVKLILELDPSGMLDAFAEMMKTRIVMPGEFMRDASTEIGGLFDEFSAAAQRLNVYTVWDYIEILKKLIRHWAIEDFDGLSDSAKRSQEYLVSLPDRLTKIASRKPVPNSAKMKNKWVLPNGRC